MELLSWIDRDLEVWVRPLSRVPNLLNERPYLPMSIAAIVPAKDAWEFYQAHSAYICQSQRYFQNIGHIGFYYDGAIQREVPKILKRIDGVSWVKEEIDRRYRTGLAEDARIAELIKAGRASKWTDDEYQVFLLTKPDADGYADGHVTLGKELLNSKKGRGSAWVQRQRYVEVGKLKEATSLAELDQ